MDKKKAVGYVRVSDAKLMPNETEKQTYEIKAYVEHSNDYELIDIYADEGTARDGVNRLESFERMLQDAESHKFDSIIVYSWNRFTRDSVQLKSVLYHLLDIGIEVVFIKDNIRTSDLEFKIERNLALKIADTLATVEKQALKVRVAGYARIGNPTSVTRSISKEEQIIKDYVAKESNWEFEKMYADQGSVGKNKKLLCFEQMLKDAEKHKFDILVVKNIRRFSVDMVEALKAVRRLTEAEVMVIFIDEEISSADEGFNIRFSLLSAMEDTRREMLRKKRRKKTE